MKKHTYSLKTEWTGNTGQGTANYRVYDRSYTVSIQNKPDLLGSSDPAFRGDSMRHNPEELLLASLSSCHLLWYLHLCSELGIIVETPNGSGYFTEVTLNPVVTITEVSMIEKAIELHKKANERCFIANSVTFKVLHHAICTHKSV